jgi:hypothetical protein
MHVECEFYVCKSIRERRQGDDSKVAEAPNEKGELDKMANVLKESQISSNVNMHFGVIVVFLHLYAIYTASIMNSIILKLLHIPCVKQKVRYRPKCASTGRYHHKHAHLCAFRSFQHIPPKSYSTYAHPFHLKIPHPTLMI